MSVNADRVPEFVIDAARASGNVPPGGYRVVVLEADQEISVSDFGNLQAAEAYATDAASESDGPGGSPLAYIFDEKLRLIGRGRHYAAR
jgi:hypothetical protein